MSKRKKVKSGKRGVLKLTRNDTQNNTFILSNKSGPSREYDGKIIVDNGNEGIIVELNYLHNQQNNITREIREFVSISEAYNYINDEKFDSFFKSDEEEVFELDTLQRLDNVLHLVISKKEIDERNERRARLGLEPDRSWS